MKKKKMEATRNNGMWRCDGIEVSEVIQVME